ncbi:site-specific integrase [bacterium]|nr:site-specific integrase [bacterium]
MTPSWLARRKDKDGIYYVHWKDAEGRTQRRSTGKRNLSEARLRQAEIDARRALVQDTALSKAVERYLELSQTRVTPLYYSNLRTYLKVFSDRLEEGARVEEVSSKEIARFKEYLLLEQKRSRTTVNHYLSGLRQFFEWAVETGRAIRNPVEGVRRIPGSAPCRERIVTDEEFKAIFSNAKLLYTRLALTLMRYGGLRNGEVVNLQWKDIDEEKGLIRVVHQPPERRTKSGKTRLTLLPQPACGLLRQWQKKAADSKWVFAHCNGQRMDSLNKSLSTAIRNAGFKDITPYHLRHTFVTEMIGSGVDPVAVMQMAGHSSLRVTERYTHLHWDHIESALKRAGMR